MKTLYLECAMGAAGDMLMGALYELLDDKEGFLRAMNAMGLPGVEVRAERAETAGIAGTKIRVLVHGEEEGEHEPPHEHGHAHPHDHHHEHDHSHEHPHEHPHDHAHPHEHIHVHAREHMQGDEHVHTHLHEHPHPHPHHHEHRGPGEVAKLIDGLALPEEVRARARAVYDRIAEAEAKAHGCAVGDVHFHEVGALDAVADVAGVCYAAYLIGAERVAASPVHVGSGTVRCAHGVMPVPAPATAYLLEGVPVYGGAVQGELCTPTGAALVRELAESFGPLPVMTIAKTGVGTGTKRFEQANCVRAFLGEACGEKSGANGEICELVCNLDDMTPEAIAYAAEKLLEGGALDVYLVPGTMKKGRPGHVMTVLCEVSREEETARRVFALTTTNGLRVRRCGKYYLTPSSETVETAAGPVRVKTAAGYGAAHRKPEYEDLVRLDLDAVRRMALEESK